MSLKSTGSMPSQTTTAVGFLPLAGSTLIHRLGAW
jgi:hypothetical protein